MKASELRTGNWILMGKDGLEIMHQSEPTTLMMLNNEIDTKGILFKPVLLTEEILKKCGFKKQKSSYINVWSIRCKKTQTYFSIHETGESFDYNELSLKEPKTWWSFSGNNHDVKIEYLHQLQNLYYVLTQEELQIQF